MEENNRDAYTTMHPQLLELYLSFCPSQILMLFHHRSKLFSSSLFRRTRTPENDVVHESRTRKASRCCGGEHFVRLQFPFRKERCRRSHLPGTMEFS
ncbi:hypothetical protein EUGRSUZ_K02395 [Eucalyptus grandis]|uniref:Uncharacterized protein n=2 Tax=Eucalyptus grandis TaxID=71139 RepID=A0ACC3IY10_EUCGR|nr:hypothetical protein EUGRSUZ_K02395 [Eucalyptus grandis]